MPTFKNGILSLLNDIKGSGSFVSHHVAALWFPGLKVDNQDFFYTATSFFPSKT